ncbi:PAS domain S-box protein [Methylovulum miyakonense]|uniref:PAS domain S-box protein n=1 Tax=Methylovulum miyakonense TaxID=645578 RepID=UPI000363C585|nr:PAS domain S-box protein [Methylovulum miyakonense]
MNNKLDGIESRQLLRTEAEKLVGSLSPEKMTAQPTEILLHELLVHKIELEMQNEELRRALIAIEEARDRFVDLYEFAPIGYITITREGLMSELNLTGSSLLGIDRTKLLKRRFSQFVAPDDKDRWHRLFLNMMGLAKADKQTFDLQMLHPDGSVFHAHLDCLRNDPVNAQPTLRVALTDISKSKQVEKGLRIAAAAFESQEGIFVTDANNVILKVNPAFTGITGFSPEEAIGHTPRMLRSGRHGQTFYAAMWHSLHTTGAWQGEIWNLHKNGGVYPAWLTITAVHGDDGGLLHYVAAQGDISKGKAWGG